MSVRRRVCLLMLSWVLTRNVVSPSSPHVPPSRDGALRDRDHVITGVAEHRLESAELAAEHDGRDIERVADCSRSGWAALEVMRGHARADRGSTAMHSHKCPRGLQTSCLGGVGGHQCGAVKSAGPERTQEHGRRTGDRTNTVDVGASSLSRTAGLAVGGADKHVWERRLGHIPGSTASAGGGRCAAPFAHPCAYGDPPR